MENFGIQYPSRYCAERLILMIFISVVCHFTCALGMAYDIIQEAPGDELECNSTAVVRCTSSVNSSYIDWTIAPNVATHNVLAAQCISSGCSINPSYSLKYGFTFDRSRSVSNATIKKITFEQENLEFKCDDGTTSDPLKSRVRESPNNRTVSIHKTFGKDTVLRIETTCIYPMQDIVIEWYSMGEDKEQIKHRADFTGNVTCNYSSDCIVAYKSAQFTSFLNISQITISKMQQSTQSSQERTFEVVIKYGSRNFTLELGSFSVPVIQSTNTVTGSGLSVSDIIALSAAIPSCTIAIVILVIVIVRCMRDRRIKASDAPGTPVGFELVRDSVTEVSAAFRCRPKPYQPGKQEIILFCQQANGNHIANTTQIIEEAGAGPIILRINNLKQGCVYDCCVFAKGNNIPSENSNQIRITTLGLPDAPTDFRVVRVENNYINLSWIPGHYRMNKQRFVLELMDMKNGNITVETIRMSHVIPLMHTVEPLPAGTTFIINLRAENDVGCSEVVGPIEVTTTGNPEPPSELKEAGVTSTSITISWRPGTYRRQTQYFVIEYGRKKKKLENIKWKQKKKVDDDQTVMMYTLNNLKSGTTYVVVIFARNDIGESKRTVRLLVKTKEENLDN